MLENQWFIFSSGSGEAVIDHAALPPKHRSHTASIPGPITLRHGPSVLVEEDEDTCALAIGDTRALRNLKAFTRSAPDRHAALFILNKKTGALRVVTDRINFSKIFLFTEPDGGFALTTHLTFLARPRLALSVTGLACGIANGTQFSNSTIFRDVTVLERAAFHEFHDAQRTATPYWHYGFHSPAANRPAKQNLVKQEMKDALVDAVRDQVCDRPLLVSLSGGFDSSGILGILHKFAKPESVHTFSYVFGEPQKGSDALVARQMAQITGYPHDLIQAYDGDIAATIRRNAALGQGLTNFCDEIDAWQHQAQTAAPGSVVLAGDECFGWADRRIVSTDDVLVSVCLRKFDFAAAVSPWLDASLRREMSDTLAAEIDAIVARNAAPGLHDTKDVLYLHHRLQWGLLPWRRFLIGDSFEVREPFLQTSVLDLIKRLPLANRIGKALYREAIQELVPEVFAVPRARTGQATPRWRKELVESHTAIRELLKKPSTLDAVIEPAILTRMLDSLVDSGKAAPRQSLSHNLKMTARNLVGPAATRALRSFVRPETPKYQAPETILLRLLVLREFLRTDS